MAKQRMHNEWFRTVSLNNRKSCPCCKKKLEQGEAIWSWGNYVCAKWRTITHFCKNCFDNEVANRLKSHTDECGCTVQIVIRDSKSPEWLTLEPKKECSVAA